MTETEMMMAEILLEGLCDWTDHVTGYALGWDGDGKWMASVEMGQIHGRMSRKSTLGPFQAAEELVRTVIPMIDRWEGSGVTTMDAEEMRLLTPEA